MKKTVIIIIVLLVIGAGVWFVMAQNNDSDTTSTTTNQSASEDNGNTTAPETTSKTSACPAPAANIITLCEGKIITTTYTAGSTITVKNDSNAEFQLSSDPHPSHTINPELNAKAIGPGETTTVKVTKKGTWGVHNHDNQAETGTVIVQ